MKKLSMIAVAVLATALSGAAEKNLLNNGSFENFKTAPSPKWQDYGSFWKGAGTCGVSTQEALDGKQSLLFKSTKEKSSGQASSELFELIPDQKYRVSYGLKRKNAEMYGRLSIEFSVGKKNGAFVCHAKDKTLNTWLNVGGNKASILFFLPRGSKRMYIGINDGIISIPSKIYGKAPVKCRGKLYAGGIGEVFFDKIVIEKVAAK